MPFVIAQEQSYARNGKSTISKHLKILIKIDVSNFGKLLSAATVGLLLQYNHTLCVDNEGNRVNDHEIRFQS